MEPKHIFKAFLFFYKTKYNHSYLYNDNSQQLCSKFITLLEREYDHIDRIGETFLWNYFVYQFEYWSRLEIKSFNKKINLSFIIGEKAFNRYIGRDTEYDWQIEQDSRTYSRQKFIEALSLPQHTQGQSTYDPDEIYREKFLNQEKGLSNCIIYTTLFNPKSPSCQVCKFVEDCKSSQKQMYPHVYRERNRKIVYNRNNGTKPSTK